MKASRWWSNKIGLSMTTKLDEHGKIFIDERILCERVFIENKHSKDTSSSNSIQCSGGSVSLEISSLWDGSFSFDIPWGVLMTNIFIW